MFRIQKLTTDEAQVRIAADGGANCLYHAAGQHGDPCFVHFPKTRPLPRKQTY